MHQDYGCLISGNVNCKLEVPLLVFDSMPRI
jgi:hypothetical protein